MAEDFKPTEAPKGTGGDRTETTAAETADNFRADVVQPTDATKTTATPVTEITPATSLAAKDVTAESLGIPNMTDGQLAEAVTKNDAQIEGTRAYIAALNAQMAMVQKNWATDEQMRRIG